MLDAVRKSIISSATQHSASDFLPHTAPLLEKKRERPPPRTVRESKAPNPLSSVAPPARSPHQRSPKICLARGSFPRSSRSGSTDRKRTAAGVACRSAILGKPCLRSSTETPHQICASFAASCSGPQSSSRRRSDRFVSTWYVCQRAKCIAAATREIYDERNLFVEQIAHRVDENHPGLTPPQRLRQFSGNKPQVEALLEGMALHAAEPFSEPFRVAVLAAWTDLRATANRVPCRVSPFDFRKQRHVLHSKLRLSWSLPYFRTWSQNL